MIEKPENMILEGIQTLEICSCPENTLNQDKSCGCQKPGMHLLHPKKDPLIIHFRGQHWSILCFVPYLLRILTEQEEQYKNLYVSHEAQGMVIREHDTVVDRLQTEHTRLKERMHGAKQDYDELVKTAGKIEGWMQQAITQAVELAAFMGHSDECNLIEIMEAGRVPSTVGEEEELCTCGLITKAKKFRALTDEITEAYSKQYEHERAKAEEKQIIQDKVDGIWTAKG